MSPMVAEVSPLRAFFAEEKVISIDGANTFSDTGGCMKPFDPEASIPLRDTETGELTGESMPQSDLYVILYSLYIQAALERDAAL